MDGIRYNVRNDCVQWSVKVELTAKNGIISAIDIAGCGVVSGWLLPCVDSSVRGCSMAGGMAGWKVLHSKSGVTWQKQSRINVVPV